MHSLRLAITLILTILVSACGGSGTVTMNVKSLSTATVFNEKTGTTETYADLLAREQAQAMANGDYGEATVGSGGLTSFKMYFRQIKLCKNLTISGSGYSSEEGCAAIYENTSDSYEAQYDNQVATSFNRTAAIAAGTGKYFDILSTDTTTGRPALTRSVSIPSGTYNYGVIEAHHWIKLTGAVTAGPNVCTASGGSESFSTGGDGIKTYFTEVTSLACGTASEATVWVNSSNTHFRFLQPFVVNNGDSVDVDLAFNLNNELRGGKPASALNSNLRDGSGNKMLVPMLRMVPVPRKSGESTKVEVYTITPASSALWKLRVELYYNSADTNKTILAALLSPIASTPGTSDINLAQMAFYANSVEQSGTTVTFKSYDGSTVLIIDRSGTSATITCPKSSSGSYSDSTNCGAATVTGTYSTPTTLTFGT